MPAPGQNLLVAAPAATMTVALAPAHNAIQSLVLLAHGEEKSGLTEWVEKTKATMSAAELERHRLVMLGFYYALLPKRSWSSFPAFLNRLASMPPLELRDRLLDSYLRMPTQEDVDCVVFEVEAPSVAIDEVLADADSYLAFLRERFAEEYIDEDMEREAWRYLNDPPQMQALVTSHLSHMWERYLEPEWRRVEPMLTDAVMAFSEVDLEQMNRLEAARFVTGHPLEEPAWSDRLDWAESVVFVPSAHIGPYLSVVKMGKRLVLVFGARLPEGTGYHAPDLSRAEIVVHLSALADDTRLHILRLVGDEGELRSQEIMDRLDLSQSATSRHLKQLSATGYLSERRCGGAKCYRLNHERIEETLDAVAAFLIDRA